MANKIIFQNQVNNSNKGNPIIEFESLILEREPIYNQEEEIVDYDESPFEELNYVENNSALLGKFFKKINIQVEANRSLSNSQSIYLKNLKDSIPHFNMTREIYETYKTLLDTMNIVIFINEDEDYQPLKDKRLQHLIKYLQTQL